MGNTVIKIPSELFALAESSRFEGTADVPTMSIGPDDYRFEEPLAWQVDVTNTGSALLVAGKVSASGTCACSRCLEDVHHAFDGDIEGYFLIQGESTADFEEDEDAPGEDEFDVLPDDHLIDLLPLIRAAMMVDAPSVPLCREDCAGLCPSCGANLNDGPCGCGGDEALRSFEQEANPFSVLANLTFDE